jgi:lipoprotein-anchoring transpeptidase ErfK/SrfK
VNAGQVIIIPDAKTVTDLSSVSPASLAPSAPAATISVGKQIIVDLSDSRIYAYENSRLVRSVLASTGLPATPTVKGSFTVQRKYPAQLMSGPGYYLPNVQWIMYFYAGYAVHGTYWHNNFGQPMSHGCVNLPNDEALWFYDWAPVGTPVTVQA